MKIIEIQHIVPMFVISDGASYASVKTIKNSEVSTGHMAYQYSQLDKRNLKWFAKINTRASLASIKLEEGHIRGLKPFEMEFKYPISAVAGANGTGKSTILALAACAFHNKTNGFKPSSRKYTYYTFSDFFVQTREEIPPSGVKIRYGIRHNKWRRKEPGVAYQGRSKRQGGRWNNYDTRVSRNVIYFGVQRVVPYFERSTHKSYRSYFRPGSLSLGVKKQIAEIAGRILDKSYYDFENNKHSKYSLPVVSDNGITYSGFNMGAGESAVFEILSSLFQAGEGTLLVIDEIEIGLHEKAQYQLIQELKQLCFDMKCQVICSTHSHAILSSLPPEGKFFVESTISKTVVIPGISADFACGKMGKLDAQEVDIFVEDDVAEAILRRWFPLETRKRVCIIPIGSHAAVIRQLTSRYMEKKNNCLCVLDGDQQSRFDKAKRRVAKYAEASSQSEKDEANAWAENRISYLPGKHWPEKWLIEEARDFIQIDAPKKSIGLVKCWGLSDTEQLLAIVKEASKADKHSEFFELGKIVGLDADRVRDDIIIAIKNANPNIIDCILDKLSNLLE